ncbi:MAG TPA: DUF433 domain-containing protein [Pyrinomonadaceae bacterium]|nr:DUF433 domain-containing protein [Pyrinomonadaceae bacterium]
MKKEYVVKKNGGYYITDSRVSLDSVVYMFRDGSSAEAIRWSFPILTLEEVYGAIAFYLKNQKKVDVYLEESEIDFRKQADERRAELKKNAPELYRRLKNRKVAVQ